VTVVLWPWLLPTRHQISEGPTEECKLRDFTIRIGDFAACVFAPTEKIRIAIERAIRNLSIETIKSLTSGVLFSTLELLDP
jgi:hypothetical protein